MLGTVSSQLGVLQLGALLGGAETPVDEVPLELCCATTHSLMPIRRTLALNPERESRSLVPVRRTKVLC